MNVSIGHSIKILKEVKKMEREKKEKEKENRSRP